MQKITVVLADTHLEFRENLYRLLTGNKDIDMIGQAKDGQEIVKLCGHLKPNIAVIDSVLPKLNGMEATRQIKQDSPDTDVIILSDSNYMNFILSCLRAGAAGYLFKDKPVKDIVVAIRLVHAGEGINNPKPANNSIGHTKNLKNGKTNLTLHTREIEILKLAGKGLRNKEMAKELSLSERTIQAHLSNIFNKLEVGSRTEAVLKGLNEGLLTINDLSC